MSVTQEIEAGLQKSRDLLEELQATNQRLKSYAGQAEELFEDVSVKHGDVERLEPVRAGSFDLRRERCRDLLRYKLEGRTFAQIQELMGAASINTIYTWDFRCRKHLLELMGGDWETK